MSSPGRPPRAPALHLSGHHPGGQAAFRLPLPPAWVGRPLAARAAERRARKAYFAALDALHLGRVSDEAVGRLQRLVAEERTRAANRPLEHLLRVFGAARRAAGRPVLMAPPEPLAQVTVGVPDELWIPDRARREAALHWPLEWLRMHRFVVGKGLALDCRPLHGAGGTSQSLPARPQGLGAA